MNTIYDSTKIYDFNLRYDGVIIGYGRTVVNTIGVETGIMSEKHNDLGSLVVEGTLLNSQLVGGSNGFEKTINFE
jgi:hypothetical protein